MTPSSKSGQPSRGSQRGAALNAPTAVLRRVPRQERGRERVEKILDSAAAVIADVGVDAATTNAIAARAQTSVGSLYQFFPNKGMIVEALAARYNVELRRINERALPLEAAFVALSTLVEHVVTPMLQFHLDNPAYRYIYHATNGPQGPSCDEAELHKAVVARVETVLRVRAPAMRAETRHLHATVAVLTVHALLGFAMTASIATREGIVRELKRMMVAYVEHAIAGCAECTAFDETHAKASGASVAHGLADVVTPSASVTETSASAA